jgi:hypothetical protein
MADDIQDILQERFKETPEPTADTATTETKQEETATDPVLETVPAANEGASQEEATITEVVESVTTDPATPVVTETKPEVKNDSPLEALYQKLGVKSEDEISAKFSELQSLKDSKTLGKLIDDLSAKGVDPQTAVAFHKLDIDKLSDSDKIAWDYKMKYPSLTEEGIAALIEKEYGDEADVAGRAKMTIDAAKAAQSLSEQKIKVLDTTPAPKYEDVKAKEAQVLETQRVDKWKSTPMVKDVVASLNKIEQKVSFSTFGEDKPVNKSFNFSYPIPKQDLAEIENTLRLVGIQQGLDPNKA